MTEAKEEIDMASIVSTQNFTMAKAPTQIVTVYNDRAEVTRSLSATLSQKGN